MENYPNTFSWRKFWFRLHIDMPLLIALFSLAILGLFILYSAGNKNLTLIGSQVAHLLLAFGVMFIFAQIPSRKYKTWTPWVFTMSLAALLAVFALGAISKGAQRWLSLGLFSFQP